MEHLLEGCGSQDSESDRLRSPVLDADFRCWHQTDLPPLTMNVGFQA
jgi:hypothetical protein